MTASTSQARRPGDAEFGGGFANYIRLVEEDQILPVFEAQLGEMLSLLGGLPEAIGNTRHAPYLWSVKEVLGHLNDSERVFAYRALAAARDDTATLPSFDENAYAQAGRFDDNALASLLQEFEFLRRANLAMFANFPAAAWDRSIIAGGARLTVRAWAYVIAGHARHHLRILAQRLATG